MSTTDEREGMTEQEGLLVTWGRYIKNEAIGIHNPYYIKKLSDWQVI